MELDISRDEYRADAYTLGVGKENKVIDGCLVSNELDLAQFRVSYLEPSVHEHYFFEAPLSFSRQEKPLYFANARNRFPAKVKIVSIPVPPGLLEMESRWAIEEYCRDWAMGYLAEKFPDFAILFSDIDEVPSQEQIKSAVRMLKKHDLVSFPLTVSYRYPNWVSREKWRKAKLFLGMKSRPGIRYLPGRPAKGEPGLHFRYLGFGAHEIARKHAMFSHQELDISELGSTEILEACDDFHISNLPRFQFGECGLLQPRGKESLTDVQLAYLNVHPEHFQFDTPRYSRLERRLAYAVFSEGIRNGLSQTELQQAIYERGFKRFGLLLQLIFQQSQLPRVARLISRLFAATKAKTPESRSLWHVVTGTYVHGDLRLKFN